MALPSIEHQLPVYSPLSLRDVATGARWALRRPGDGGPEIVEALRSHLVRAYGASAASLWGSGTQALQMAMETARQARGESRLRVALPAYSCFDVLSAAVGAGALVLFYDLDPETLAPDPASLERVLGEGVGALVVAPLYGVPIPWTPIRSAARSGDTVLIEDAAQGHGAEWEGAPLGSLGDLSVLSFGRGKGWTGCGGGALLVRDRPDLEAALEAASQGGSKASPGLGAVLRAAAQWAIGRPALYGAASALPWLHLGETRYRDPVSPEPISPASAALVHSSADAARHEAGIRRENARWLLERIRSTADRDRAKFVRLPPQGRPGFLRLPLRLPGGGSGLGRSRRWRPMGVAPGYPAILPALPAARERTVDSDDRFPGARSLAKELVTLPTHSRLGDRDRESLVRCIAG